MESLAYTKMHVSTVFWLIVGGASSVVWRTAGVKLWQPVWRKCASVESGHTCFATHVGRRKKLLPDRESNPGLPRDRRRYSPLYYRGTIQLMSLPQHNTHSHATTNHHTHPSIRTLTHWMTYWRLFFSYIPKGALLKTYKSFLLSNRSSISWPDRTSLDHL